MRRGMGLGRLVLVLLASWAGVARGQTADEFYERAEKLAEAQQYEQSLAVARQSLRAAEREYGREDARVASHLQQVAFLCAKQQPRQIEEADRLCLRWIALSERVAGAESPEVVEALVFQANLHFVQKDARRASVPIGKAATIVERQAPRSTRAAEVFQRAGQIQAQLKQMPESGRYYRSALTAYRAADPPEPRRVAECLDGLAMVEMAAGRRAQAETLLREAVREVEQAYGEEAAESAYFLMSLAQVVPRKAPAQEAESLLQRALTIAEKQFGAKDYRTVVIVGNLGMLYRELGKTELAEPLLQRAAESRRPPDTEQPAKPAPQPSPASPDGV